MRKKINRFFNENRAAVMPFVGIMLTMLLMVIGLVFDLGHLYVVRQELQNAADAGASAGAGALYAVLGKTPSPGTTLCDAAKTEARATVMVNKSDGVALSIPTVDAQVGIWGKNADGKYVFTETSCSNNVNAVHVITRRTQAVNGAVPTLFARILGRDFTEVTANATALLGWVSKLRKGCGFPVALDKDYLPAPGQRMHVIFSPSTLDVGSWHTFTISSASASVIKEIINGTTPSPPISIGTEIELNNGWDASVLQDMRKILDGYKKDGKQWIVILPVINTQNYVQTSPVLGFCAFEVTAVESGGNKYIEGYALGGYVAPVADEVSVTPGSDQALRSSTPKMVY